MSVLLRIAAEKREADMPEGARAYAQLRRCAQEGLEIKLPDHALVLAISRAVWAEEPLTAQLGLTELEIRTSAEVLRRQERKAA